MVAKENRTSFESKEKKIYLNHVKNSFFEKKGQVVLTLYVKNLNAEKTLIKFNDTNISIEFKTNDANFLKENNADEDANALFVWNFELNDRIDPDNCDFKINKFNIELSLCKHQSSFDNKWSHAIKRNLSNTECNDQIKQDNKKMLFSEQSEKTSNDINQNSNSDKLNEEVRVESSFSKEKNPSQQRSPSSSVSPPPCSARLSSSSSSVSSTSNSNRESFSNEKLKFLKNSNYGLIGLANLGNTCYMNAALQCLVNSTDLRDYFLETPSIFQKDLNTKNALGLNGRMAIAFAMLLKHLWRSNQSYVAPNQLRELMCSKFSHFRGFEQQDTQEFMCSFLSILHEDLNRVLKKPFYESNLECEEDTDYLTQKIANESWQRFLSRENSFIIENFYGQFKSKLNCPECNKVSITFEPFSNLLVPLPMPKRSLSMLLGFHYSKNKTPIQLNIFVSENETIKNLINQIKSKFSDLKSSSFEVFILNQKQNEEIDGVGFDNNWDSVSLNQTIPILKNNQYIFMCEVDLSANLNEPIMELRVQQCSKYPLLNNRLEKCSFCKKIESSNEIDAKEACNLRRCTRCYRSAYCNAECQKNDWPSHSSNLCTKPFDLVGLPFVLTIRKSDMNKMNDLNSFLRKVFYQMSSHSVDLSNFDEENFSNFDIEIVNDTNNLKKNLNKLESLNKIHELFENSINKKNIENNVILKLQLKWNNNFNNSNNSPKKALKVITNLEKIISLPTWKEPTIKLDDCLNLFTEPEKLTSENPWYCSKCKKHQEATKQMHLWKLSKYLFITLKRFQASKAATPASMMGNSFSNSYLNYFLQNRVVYNKLNYFVDFPLRGLDMSKYLFDSNTNNQNKENYLYDLCGVVNHHGQSLYLGHYTAYCRTHDSLNTLNDELGWRYFDDSRVVSIKNEEQIVTKDAYVLVYRLRTSDSLNKVYNQSQSQNMNAHNNKNESLFKPELASKDEDEDEYFDTNNSNSGSTNISQRSSRSNSSSSSSDSELLDLEDKKTYTNLNDID